jgi:hypothetical protein
VYADNVEGKSVFETLRSAGVDVAGAKVVVCDGGSVVGGSVADGESVVLSILRELGEAEVGAVALLGSASSETLTQTAALFRKLGGMRLSSKASGILSGNRGQIVGIYSNIGAHVPEAMPQAELAAFSYEQAAEALEGADVLIKVGAGEAVLDGLLHGGLAVLDLDYKRNESALVTAARTAGAVVLDGREVLVEQVALSIELWTDAQGKRLEAPRDMLRQLL